MGVTPGYVSGTSSAFAYAAALDLSGRAVGDVVLAMVQRVALSAPTSVPSGWQLLEDASSDPVRTWLYGKQLAAGDLGTHTWTWAGNAKTLMTAAVYTGCAASDAIADSAAGVLASASATAIDCGSLYTRAAWVVAFGYCYSTSSKTYNALTGWTERRDAGSTDPDFWHLIADTAGNWPGGTCEPDFVTSAAATYRGGFLVSLRVDPEPPEMARELEPQLRVVVAGQDVTDLVDYETCVDIDSERGEASATIEIPVAGENEVPVNGLERDAEVVIDRGGRTPWVGHVVAAHKPSPGDDPRWRLDCAGGWAQLTRSAAWCMGFVERRDEAFGEFPPSEYADLMLAHRVSNVLDFDTGGQFMVSLPKGSKVKYGQGRMFYYWPQQGMDRSAELERLTMLVNAAGNDYEGEGYVVLELRAYSGTPFAGTYIDDVDLITSAGPDSGSRDYSLPAGTTWLLWGVYSGSDLTSETTEEEYIQCREIACYIGRTDAPTVDEVVVEIDANARPDGLAAASETVGDPLVPFMVDPLTTPAQGIAQALAKVPVPPLCGIWQNRMTIRNRPAAPDGASKLWIVSEELTPGLEWGVEIDEEQSVDYVGCSCTSIDDDDYPDGTPQLVFVPEEPANIASARCGLVDGGELTYGKALEYAYQAYRWMHRLPQGPVVVPYVVHDENGAEWPAEAIRSWDWIQNVGSLDPETSGPHLVSDVQRQGGIATLTIGNMAAYDYTGPERLDGKGRYRRGHWARTRRKEWSKSRKRPKGGRWKKAANGRWWRWKLRWVEGRYT